MGDSTFDSSTQLGHHVTWCRSQCSLWAPNLSAALKWRNCFTQTEEWESGWREREGVKLSALEGGEKWACLLQTPEIERERDWEGPSWEWTSFAIRHPEEVTWHVRFFIHFLFLPTFTLISNSAWGLTSPSVTAKKLQIYNKKSFVKTAACY